MPESVPNEYPGQMAGLPASGPGSLAPWRNRIAALLVDWAASLFVATGAFGSGVMQGHDWRMWMPYVVFFVETVLFTLFVGGSFGQLLARIAVVRIDHQPLGWWRAIVRTLMKCAVLPALIMGGDRRAVDDLLLGTAVVNRR